MLNIFKYHFFITCWGFRKAFQFFCERLTYSYISSCRIIFYPLVDCHPGNLKYISYFLLSIFPRQK
nr:MAG TPA: hypothetical protein [Caudoviricetes sp.]